MKGGNYFFCKTKICGKNVSEAANTLWEESRYIKDFKIGEQGESETTSKANLKSYVQSQCNFLKLNTVLNACQEGSGFEPLLITKVVDEIWNRKKLQTLNEHPTASMDVIELPKEAIIGVGLNGTKPLKLTQPPTIKGGRKNTTSRFNRGSFSPFSSRASRRAFPRRSRGRAFRHAAISRRVRRR